jgi:hypothetical protein
VPWRTLKISGASKGIYLLEDEYSAKADRIIRLIYRQWPPKDRVASLKEIWDRNAKNREDEKNLSPMQKAFRDRAEEEIRKAEIKKLMDIPVPGPGEELNPAIS